MATPAGIPPSIEKLLSEREGAGARRPATGAFGRGRPSARPPTGSGGACSGRSPDAAGALLDAAEAALALRPPAGPRPVVNATGVLLHTNLGRAPLAVAARDAVLRACGYSTLELDLATGGRGKRGEHVRPLLLALFAPGPRRPRRPRRHERRRRAPPRPRHASPTAAPSPSRAASSSRSAATSASRRSSRGAAPRSSRSGRRTGRRPRTTPRPSAPGPRPILKVRPSNYRIVGFTEEVALAELAALCREAARPAPLRRRRGLSAAVRRARPARTSRSPPRRSPREPTSSASRETRRSAGRRRASSSARAALVGACARNPLARALRPDKLVLAALAATLDLHLVGAGRRDPLPRDARGRPSTRLEERARRLAAAAAALGWDAEAAPLVAVAGGGDGNGVDAPVVRRPPPAPVARRDRGRRPAPFAGRFPSSPGSRRDGSSSTSARSLPRRTPSSSRRSARRRSRRPPDGRRQIFSSRIRWTSRLSGIAEGLGGHGLVARRLLERPADPRRLARPLPPLDRLLEASPRARASAPLPRPARRGRRRPAGSAGPARGGRPARRRSSAPGCFPASPTRRASRPPRGSARRRGPRALSPQERANSRASSGTSSSPGPQRREPDREDVETVEEVLAERRPPSRGRRGPGSWRPRGGRRR